MYSSREFKSYSTDSLANIHLEDLLTQPSEESAATNLGGHSESKYADNNRGLTETISWRAIGRMRGTYLEAKANDTSRPTISRGNLGGWDDAEDYDAKVMLQARQLKDKHQSERNDRMRSALLASRQKEAEEFQEQVTTRLMGRSAQKTHAHFDSRAELERSLLNSRDLRQYEHEYQLHATLQAKRALIVSESAPVLRSSSLPGNTTQDAPISSMKHNRQSPSIQKIPPRGSPRKSGPATTSFYQCQVSRSYVHASTQQRERIDRPASLQLQSIMRLTDADQGAVQVMEAAWEAKHEEERIEREKKKDLLAKRAERVLSLILTQAARDAETKEAEDAAKLEELLAAEKARAQRYRKGVYGPMQVWIETIPPLPPAVVEANRARQMKRSKSIMDMGASETVAPSNEESQGLTAEKLLKHPENSEEFEVFPEEDREDEEQANFTMQISKSKSKGKLKKRQSIYPEDTEYEYFFLKPPPQMTIRIPGIYTPSSQVPPEDLPDIERPRPENFERKKAICLAFRATGLPLDRRGNLLPEDAEGIKAAIFKYLAWVRFNMLKYENGLEVRSMRTLRSSDFEIYLTRNIKEDRIRVGVMVWILKKQATRAARTLARVALDGLLAEELARQCPSLAFANGETIIRPVVGVVEAPLLKDGSRSPTSITMEPVISSAEIDRYSVMSPASSKALWTLSVRIEAGLDIPDTLLLQALHDLEIRSKQFTCTNLGFERDRKRAMDAFANFKSDVGAWRSTLYSVLLETEFGQQQAKDP